ncbi:YjjW family glycine radical enzyme activase [Vibrio sinaloensis]|uniref:YjjW family glycine radical enzyme activase n=1 Tax=Photobacterium sp. (strain ATCC 43367) TaxID=379097 RepID=UPI000300A082|nr:YjjW family glycine radical enzyme activase [Vibrio sinaloensis]
MRNERQALVSRILPFSCVDGPGNRLVIFLQGCNFTCISCHNPHTINHCNHCGECVESCPTQALQFGKEGKVDWQASLCIHCDRCIEACRHHASPKVSHYSVTDLIEVITKQSGFISGVTVSGGEATLQLPFIVELFKSIKQSTELNHLTCFVDSNGYLAKDGWNKLLPYLDGAMIDLKAWSLETHQWLVGRDNHRVIESIKWLGKHKKLHELRLLHIPNRSDLDQEIGQVARLIYALPKDVIVRLNAFQHHGVRGEALSWPKCSQSQLEGFHRNLAAIIDNPIVTPSVYL